MRTMLLTGFLAAGLLAPAMAHAQAAPAADMKTEQVFVIRPAQVLAIGAGVIVGAVAVEALISSEIGYIVGGVVGGYLANVWYGGRQLEVHLGTAPKI